MVRAGWMRRLYPPFQTHERDMHGESEALAMLEGGIILFIP